MRASCKLRRALLPTAVAASAVPSGSLSTKGATAASIAFVCGFVEISTSDSVSSLRLRRLRGRLLIVLVLAAFGPFEELPGCLDGESCVANAAVRSWFRTGGPKLPKRGGGGRATREGVPPCVGVVVGVDDPPGVAMVAVCVINRGVDEVGGAELGSLGADCVSCEDMCVAIWDEA